MDDKHKTSGESFTDFLKNTDLDCMFAQGDFIATGIPELDERIGGLVRGDITIIGARPGEGKTAIALQIADESAGCPLYVSLEMKKKQLYARLLSKRTGIPPKVIMMNKVYENKRGDILAAHQYYKEHKVMEVYDGGGDFKDVVVAIKNHIKSGASFIIVDYLQLISTGRGENKNAEVSYISRMFKIMAMKYNIPFVVLSQLNREVEKQERSPRLSDLRDSGSLEQDSSVVLFLHDGEIIIAKDRFGETGKITTLYFNKPCSRFDKKKVESEFKNTMSYIHD
jgi:replicative DNA helicase